jgi:hypothetical protein
MSLFGGVAHFYEKFFGHFDWYLFNREIVLLLVSFYLDNPDNFHFITFSP